MSLGRRPQEQQEAWIATTDLPRSPGHPFYRKLNELLAEADFDRWVENLCAPYYAAKAGRPSIPPGVYFRMLFVGYFEGIGSQRGIAWRCSDSRSLAEFLGVHVTERTPDHSSLTRVHQRLPLDVHEAVFVFVLKLAAAKNLIEGKTVAADSTTLEANAAMKSILRKDTGEDWKAYLRRLAQAEGIEDPTDEDLRRFDKKRKGKKVPNADWESKTDGDSRIIKMKDGTTHLGYKAEHVVDLKTDLVLSATVYHGNQSDMDTLCESVMQAQTNLNEAGVGIVTATADDEAATPREDGIEIKEVAADKGYHGAETLADMEELGLRSYIPERKRKQRWQWRKRPGERREAERHAVHANRRRVRAERSKKLQRQRSEKTERSFAHVCETGAARRCWLRGLTKVNKRYLMQVAARNLGVILRNMFGIGTPRSLQGGGGLVWTCICYYWSSIWCERRPHEIRAITTANAA